MFITGSLMSKRWQSHLQERVGRLTPCLFRNFTVFKMSTRRKSQDDYIDEPLLSNKEKNCSNIVPKTRSWKNEISGQRSGKKLE
jgi:hypothetical protein